MTSQNNEIKSGKKFVFVRCVICSNEFEVDEDRGLGKTLCLDCVVRSKDIKQFSDYVNNMEVVDKGLMIYVDFAINDRSSLIHDKVNVENDMVFDKDGDWIGVNSYISGTKKNVKMTPYIRRIIDEIRALEKAKIKIVDMIKGGV